MLRRKVCASKKGLLGVLGLDSKKGLLGVLKVWIRRPVWIRRKDWDAKKDSLIWDSKKG